MSSPGSPSSKSRRATRPNTSKDSRSIHARRPQAQKRPLGSYLRKHRQSCQPDQNRSGSGPSTTPEGRPDRIALTIRKGPDAIHERDKQTV